MDNDELSGPPKLKRAVKQKKAPKPVEPELSAEDSAALERRVDAIINGEPEPIAVEGFEDSEPASVPEPAEEVTKPNLKEEVTASEPVADSAIEPEEDPGHDELFESELEESQAVPEALASAPEVPAKTRPAPKEPEPELASGEHAVEDVMVSKATDDDVWDDSEDALNEHVREPSDPDGILAEEKRLKWRRDHPDKIKKRSNKDDDYDELGGGRQHSIKTALAVLFVIFAFGGGGYWVYIHLKTPSKTATKQTVTTIPTEANKSAVGNTTTPVTTATPATTAATKHYDSQNYTLGFDYPSNWTVNDTTTKLTVTSPDVQLATAAGSQKGHVVFAVQNQQTSIAGYPSSGATASLASQLVSYKQPTAVQRAQTYVSFLGYSSASAVDMLFVTGDTGYQQGGTAAMSDIVKGNPLISAGFVTCGTTDDCASAASPVAVTADSNFTSTSYVAQILSIIQSIQLN